MSAVASAARPARAADPAQAAETARVAAGEERLAESFARFTALVDAAEALVRRGAHEEAAAAISEAATAAWFSHPGVHASPRLEALIAALPVADQPVPAGLARTRDRRARVLHVLTEAYGAGGHTRLVQRIVAAAPGPAHSCAVVAQRSGPVPAWLGATIAGAGCQLAGIETGGYLARAAALRAISRTYDLVLVYPHPNDVISALAFANPAGRPPVAMVNHADQSFWLGAASWDLLLNVRDSGRRLALRRRGIPAERMAILPAPLEERGRTLQPGEARRLLGIRPDEIVLVCAGSDWKFDPHASTGFPSFPDVVAPLVAADPRLRAFVFGPLNTGRWADAARLTQGRLQARGIRLDLAVYQEAADIYLDPFPLGSTYSLLEPAALGVPALSFWQWPEEAATLEVDSPGLGDARLVARDREGYEAALHALIDDPAHRAAIGARLGAQVRAEHVGDGWRARLASCLVAAVGAHAKHLASSGPLPSSLEEPQTGVLDRAVALIPMREPEIPARTIAHLPLGAR